MGVFWKAIMGVRQVLRPGALGRPRGIGWRGRWEGGSGWGLHVDPWLIHVNVWQKPLQYCKVISLQLIKINWRKKKEIMGQAFTHLMLELQVACIRDKDLFLSGTRASWGLCRGVDVLSLSELFSSYFLRLWDKKCTVCCCFATAHILSCQCSRVEALSKLCSLLECSLLP